MVKVIFYILISLFSFSSFSEGNSEDVETAKVTCSDPLSNKFLENYVSKSSSESLHAVCNEAKDDTDACCVNSGRCPKSIIGKIGAALSEAGPNFLQQYLKVKGSISGNSFESCKYSNLSQIVGPLDDSFKSIKKNSCSDSMNLCKATCEDHYRDFLIEFIEHFTPNAYNTNDSGANAVGSDSGNVINNINLQELKNPDVVSLDDLKDATDQIIKVCSNKDSGLFDNFNEMYKDGSKEGENFTEGDKKIEDFVLCDKILDKLDKEDIETAMQQDIKQLQLQMCQQAIKSSGLSLPSRAPNAISSANAPVGNFTGIEPRGDGNETPLDIDGGIIIPEDDGFIPISSGEPTNSNGFSGLEGAGGTSDNGGGQPAGGSPNSFAGGEGYPGEYYPEPEYWTDGSGGSSGGGGSSDNDSNFKGDSSKQSNARDVAQSTEPLNLDQYINLKQEKSIFQIISSRIQKYCSEKIKSKCL